MFGRVVGIEEGERVNGCVVAILLGDFEYVGDKEYDTVGVIVKVNGYVVGIPVFVTEPVIDLVFGLDVGIPEGDGLSDLVLERVTVLLVVGVKGNVDGIPVFVTEPVIDKLGKLEA